MKTTNRVGIRTCSDYSPFGVELDGRTVSLEGYRFGFNGNEKTDEISGSGNHTTALYWEYDSRLGRRWNIDPVVKYHESSYASFANNPIWFMDPSGADTLKILGSKNSSILINYGKGKKTTTYNLKDFNIDVDLGKQKIDLGSNVPDVIGLDINGNLTAGPFTVEGGLNILWHTRGEENCFEPEVYSYDGSGMTASNGDIDKDVSSSVSASIFWGWATKDVWDKSTKKLYDIKTISASNNWVANGYNWTGDFWTASISVGQGYKLSFAKFTSLKPGTKPKTNEPYWNGYSVGFGVGVDATGGFTKVKNFIDVLQGTSLTFTHQYYYLLYGNGRDFGENKDSLEGFNWFVSPKDY